VVSKNQWRIHLFGYPAIAAPSRSYFSFFLSRNEKEKEVVLLRKPFFDHDRRPLRQTGIPSLSFWIRHCKKHPFFFFLLSFLQFFKEEYTIC
jgi:hypothetical protein